MAIRRMLLALLVSLVGSACSLAGPPPAPVRVELGKPFSLKPGQVAQLAGGLQVGLVGVIADSRCPKGEQCAHAGSATVRVWLQQAPGAKLIRELHTAPQAGQALRELGHELRLLQLDPYPVSGRPTAPGDAVATLLLSLALSQGPSQGPSPSAPTTAER